MALTYKARVKYSESNAKVGLGLASYLFLDIWTTIMMIFLKSTGNNSRHFHRKKNLSPVSYHKIESRL